MRPSSWLSACAVLALVLATGCSGGGKDGPRGLPDPAPGKVAAFDLGGISKKYDLNDTVVEQLFTVVTSDQAGDVYMMNNASVHAYVYRMTPQGDVSRSTEPVRATGVGAMVVLADGSMVLGSSESGGDSLPVYRVDGELEALRIPPKFDHPQPVGERPDGSMVVSERGNLWAVKDGKATGLYHQAESLKRSSAVVDGTGTVYAVGDTLDEVMAVPPRGKPYHVQVSGKDPVTGRSLAGFTPVDTASAGKSGFYVIATDEHPGEYALLRVAGGNTTVVAREPFSNTSCVSGKQYPALRNPCGPQGCVVRSGTRVLLMCSLRSAGRAKPQPALAIEAATS